MFKNSKYKKNSNAKKENTLDYYISHSNSDSKKWWNEENLNNENEKKYEFLKKDIKPSYVIPSNMVKNKETPDNFGHFETSLGTMAVGYKKFKKNSDISFSIIPEKVKKLSNISEEKIDDPNLYFGGEQKRGQKNFKASKISFKYNPATTKIEKLIADNDGIVDNEKQLLYSNNKDNEKLEDLKLIRTNNKLLKENLNKEKENIRDIKKEKQEDNEKLFNEITKFIEKMKKSKLKKKIDPDEAIMRKKRIEELSFESILNNISLEELKKILSKLMKKEDFNKIKNLKKEELISMIENLKNRSV